MDKKEWIIEQTCNLEEWRHLSKFLMKSKIMLKEVKDNVNNALAWR